MKYQHENSACYRKDYVLMKHEEHKDEEWAKRPWEERMKPQRPKKLVKFSNSADRGVMKVKVCDARCSFSYFGI